MKEHPKCTIFTEIHLFLRRQRILQSLEEIKGMLLLKDTKLTKRLNMSFCKIDQLSSRFVRRNVNRGQYFLDCSLNTECWNQNLVSNSASSLARTRTTRTFVQFKTFWNIPFMWGFFFLQFSMRYHDSLDAMYNVPCLNKGSIDSKIYSFLSHWITFEKTF